MGALSVERKKYLRGNNIKDRSGYMTTTELSKLCGVSRFTIINWIKRGRIRVIKTVGNHNRIPESEALSLLDIIEKKQQTQTSTSEYQFKQQKKKTKRRLKRGICSTRNKKDSRDKSKKNNVLYAFGYGVGRSVHALKGRCKVK